jgi:hypothetical protein
MGYASVVIEVYASGGPESSYCYVNVAASTLISRWTLSSTSYGANPDSD